jgi:hypothetical protein
MPVTKKVGDQIETSPLLHDRLPQPTKPAPAHSTINPDKLDHARFSEMRDSESEGSSVRIIIYVVIVILIGVGSALLIRTLIANNQQSTQNETATDNTTTPASAMEETPEDSAMMINTSIVEDDKALNLAENADYIDSALLTVGDESVDLASASLETIEYTDYTTFSRVVFDMDTVEGTLPKTNVTFDSSTSTLTVEFVDLDNINLELQDEFEVDSLVSDIAYNEELNVFEIMLSDPSKYRVLADTDNLVVDFKTLDELAIVAETPSTDTSTEEDEDTDATDSTTTPPAAAPAPVADASKPAAPFYENEFSKVKQYVSSALTTNTISHNNYYVWDQGSFFEFSFAEDNKKGDSYVPNAEAYMEMKDNKPYLFVKVSNLAQAVFTTKSFNAEEVSAKNGVNLAGANFVKVSLESFEKSTGTALYKIELKRSADYRLLTQDTFDGKTQILSVQIKD